MTAPRLNNLQAWQKAMDLAVFICRTITPMIPREEQYALTDQLRRSVQSIPANIAEGFGRFHYLEAIHFCTIARGSLVETYSHLTFSRRMEYLDEETYQALVKQMEDVYRTLNGYISYLKRSREGSPVPTRAVREQVHEYFVDIPMDEESEPECPFI